MRITGILLVLILLLTAYASTQRTEISPHNEYYAGSDSSIKTALELNCTKLIGSKKHPQHNHFPITMREFALTETKILSEERVNLRNV